MRTEQCRTHPCVEPQVLLPRLLPTQACVRGSTVQSGSVCHLSLWMEMVVATLHPVAMCQVRRS